jgi:hypothetical protein
VPKACVVERTASSTSGAGKLATHRQKLKFDPCLSFCTKVNSKMYQRPETLKLLEEPIRLTLIYWYRK